MVGSGPLAQSLRWLAAELRIGRKVLWLGDREARGLYAAFDVFAIASCKEGLPYVVLEAISAGLPIVATASAGVEILVSPNQNGAVVQMGDASAFADALLSILRDPDRRARYSQASRHKSKQFTIERMVSQTLAAYHDAFGRGIAFEPPAMLDDETPVLAVAEGEMS